MIPLQGQFAGEKFTEWTTAVSTILMFKIKGPEVNSGPTQKRVEGY